MTGTKVILRCGDFRGFPSCCASCLGTGDLEFKFARSRGVPLLSDAFELEYPICSRCAHRVTWLRGLEIAAGLTVVLANPFVLDKYHLSSVWRFVIIVGGPLAIAYLADRGRGPVRLTKRPNRDTLTLWFANHEYARQFEAQNPSSGESAAFSQVL
jgi:hypothetical protein